MADPEIFEQWVSNIFRCHVHSMFSRWVSNIFRCHVHQHVQSMGVQHFFLRGSFDNASGSAGGYLLLSGVIWHSDYGLFEMLKKSGIDTYSNLWM